ncbi:Protein STU1 [Zancudomyces culisetae]|uniref:Protein STU1 n=1 Tax=Zancudomyces culisetae TaxID=1213189 RepID=A0A1R1PSC9_ZANCU|nr:Protein STU1 [Zancudomyces culisetae]|eukprot:OMH83851.1 Protein STU1 [Zancudomyces culisetae]
MSINTIGSKRSLRDELKREIVGRGFGHKTPREIVEKLTQKRGLRNDVIEEITTGQQRYGGSLGRGRNQYQQRSSSRNSGFGLRTQSQLSNTLSRQEGTLSRSGGTGIFGMTKMANTLTVRTPTPVSNLQTTTSNLTGNTRRAEVRADSYGSERGILTPQRTPNHKRGMNENTGSVSSGTFGAVQPLYVDSGKRVGREIMEFGTSFEGRETEDNWQRRERAVQRLRQIVAGNATEERNIGFAKNSSIENRYFNDQPAAKLNLAATLNNYKVEIQNSPSSINNGIGDNADIFQALLAFSDNEGDEQEEVFKIAKRQLRNCNSSDQLDMYIEIATQILRTSSSIESKGVIFGFSVLKIVVKQKYADIKSINALRKAVWEVLRYRFIEGADSYSEFIRGTADHLLLSFVTTLDHNLVFEFFCDSFSRIPFPNSTSDHKYDQDLDPSRILHSTRVLSALLDLFSVFLGLYPEIHTTSTQLETMWMPILVRSAIYKKSLSVRNAAVGCIVTIKNLLGITDHDFSSALLSSSSHPLSPTLANSVEGDKERNDNEHGYEDDKQIARRVFLDCLVHSLPVDHRRTILLIL